MDLTNLEYNPVGLNGIMIWDRYPELLSNHTFCLIKAEDLNRGLEVKDLSNLVSFVILFINEDYKETDIDRRIEGCFEALGIPKGNIVWNEVESHSSLFSDILYEFFRMKNSILFEDWLSLRLNLGEYYKYLRSPIGSGADIDREAVQRSQVLKNIKSLKRDVMEAEVKLFPNKQIQDLLNREAYKKSLTGYAEKYAQTHPSLVNN